MERRSLRSFRRFLATCVGPSVFFIVPYLVVSCLFALADWKLAWLRKYPLQANVYQQIWRQTFVNLFVLHPLLTGMVLWRWPQNSEELSWSRTARVLLFASMLFEVLFYAAHRVLHVPFFFRHIHFQHHELRSTVALGAVYCHPLEHVLANFLPGSVGIVLSGPNHPRVVALWSVLASVFVVLEHSGFGSGPHFLHHWKRNGNFGFLGVIDFLLRTSLKNEVPKRLEKTEPR